MRLISGRGTWDDGATYTAASADLSAKKRGCGSSEGIASKVAACRHLALPRPKTAAYHRSFTPITGPCWMKSRALSP